VTYEGDWGSDLDYPEPTQAEQNWIEAELARGTLAFQPERLPCFRCPPKEYDNFQTPVRMVTGMGPVLTPAYDATQSYILECGHYAI